MQVETVQIVIRAALDVLRQETGAETNAGAVKLLSSSQTSEQVTVMIGVTGGMRGMIILGMSQDTALGIVSRMMGEPCTELDELAQSGIAELGNVIAGHAGQGLEGAGFNVVISPPALVAGAPGMIISTVNLRRFVVPLETAVGRIMLHVALEQAPDIQRMAAGIHHHQTSPVVAGR